MLQEESFAKAWDNDEDSVCNAIEKAESIMSKSWTEVSSKLQGYQAKLIDCSRDDAFHMDPIERQRIRAYLERGESPTRPEDIPTLMKQFCVSAFSYAPLRNYLKQKAEGLPTRESIADVLFRVFDEHRFRNDSCWVPKRLGDLAARIQKRHRFDLSSRRFKPRIIRVLDTGSRKLREELKDGLDAFYKKVECVSEPSEMWKLANRLSEHISHVGPILVCDFLKEIGFARYVKIDHHFKKQLDGLVGCRLGQKESFILSQEIADSIGMTPFHIDYILYLCGHLRCCE